jgi:uncharacterized membrane protein YebE (DUF533 family)
VVTPEGLNGAASAASISTCADPALVKALARAFRYQRMLDEGRYASITEMAEAERIERGYLGSLLRLTLLAPDLVEAILQGRQSEAMRLPTRLASIDPVWEVQRTLKSLSCRTLGC